MRRRSLLAALPVLVFARQASAAGKPAGKEANTQHLDISPLALPVVLGSRVVNYIFINVRLTLAPMANIQKMQAREPFFRDALVRAGHRTPFTGRKDFVTLDEARLKSVMLREAVRLGGKDVVGVVVMSQTAKRQSGLPKHPGA